MKRKPQSRIIIVMIVALFIPIFSYTIFQFFQIDENEKVIQSLYDRQLGSIFSSINQHCWDLWDYWLSEITNIATTDIDRVFTNELMPRVQEFIDNEPAIAAAFLRYSSQHFISTWDSRYQDIEINPWTMRQRINKIFYTSSRDLAKKVQYTEAGYTKPSPEPWINASTDKKMQLLLFPIVDEILPNNGVMWAGFIIDQSKFVDEVIARRFNSMNSQEEFVFAIKDLENASVIYFSQEEMDNIDFEKVQENWLLPTLEMQIRMSGNTLEGITQKRTRINLLFLITVNIVFIFGIFYLIRNVSKEMELALMKTNFVANVSHELRTPLALIRMYAETLEMGRIKAEEKRQKYYRTIMSESARLTQLINNILDFSKIESQKKEYSKSPNMLQDLIEQVLEMYRYHLEQKGFTVTAHIQPNLSEVQIDWEAITQAFVNLLDNAVKYSTDDRRIIISVEQQGTKQTLSVQDFGIGIPDSEQKKIFEKFYRVGSSLLHNTKGSGLGLSIIRHIMLVHKGEVLVKSKPNEGSTFSLVFPIANKGA